MRQLESGTFPDVPYPTTVPDIARNEETMQLSGINPYDFEDGKPNGSSPPVWKKYKHYLPEELDLETKHSTGHI